MADSITSLINVNQFVPHINISYIVYGFVGIVLLLVMFRIYLPKTFPIIVGIKRKVGNGTVKFFDDAKIMKIDGTKQLYVYKLNRYWPVPENKYFYPCRMGFFKKWYIDMYLDSNDEIVPNEFVDIQQVRTPLQKMMSMPGDIVSDVRKAVLGRPPKKAIKPDGSTEKFPVIVLDDRDYVATLVPKRREMELWGQLQRKRVVDRFSNDFITKYGMVIGQGMVAVMMIVIVVVIMNKFTDISNNLATAYSQTLTVLQAMGRA